MGKFLCSNLLEMCVTSLKWNVQDIFVLDLVKCLPLRNLFLGKFPYNDQKPFEPIFRSNYHVSNFFWNLYLNLICIVKKIDVDVMMANCGVIVVFLIYGQFGAIWKLDSRCLVCNTYIFINCNFLLYKMWKQN